MYLVRRERKAVRWIEADHFSASPENGTEKLYVEAVERAFSAVEQAIVSICPSLTHVCEVEFGRIDARAADVLERNLCRPAEHQLSDIAPQLADCIRGKVRVTKAQDRFDWIGA